jgi:hypothetical protein
MSLTALPSGLQPAFHPSGEIRSIAHTGILLAGTNVNIFKNQPVTLAIGTGATVNGVTVPAGQVFLAPVVATGTAIWGVLAGVEYFDITGAPQETNSWLASTTVFTNTAVTAWIWEDPAIVYTIQTDGALPVIAAAGTPFAQVDGKEYNLSNFGAGSATVGLSQCTIAAGSVVATGTQGQVQVVKTDPTILNQSSTSDAFVQLQVRIARSQVIAPVVSI